MQERAEEDKAHDRKCFFIKGKPNRIGLNPLDLDEPI